MQRPIYRLIVNNLATGLLKTSEVQLGAGLALMVEASLGHADWARTVTGVALLASGTLYSIMKFRFRDAGLNI